MAHILILEDNPVFAFLLKTSLEGEGHTVSCHQSATEAYEELLSSRPDLLITDLIVFKDNRSIPDGGLSLISRVKLRGIEDHRSIPIIAISGVTRAKGLETALDTALSLGADATLSKPFSPHELMDLVETLLANKITAMKRRSRTADGGQSA